MASGAASIDNDAAGESTGAVVAALIANLGIAITKFIAAALSGSASMLAEGIHSFVDTGNQGFMLLGIKRSQKPADANHPFGYSNELYFWAFVVAILLFSIGAGLSVYEGVSHILNPGEGGGDASEFPWIPVGVLAVAAGFESYALMKAIGSFQKERAGRGLWRDLRDAKDPAIFVVMAEDTAAMIGIVIALAGVLAAWATGIEMFDGLASILIGVVLGLVAILLAIEVKRLLIGEAADPRITESVRSMIAARDEVDEVNDLRTMHLGPRDVLLVMSLDFRDDLRAGHIERIVTDLEKRIRAEYPIVRQVYLEIQSRSDHEELTGTPVSIDKDEAPAGG